MQPVAPINAVLIDGLEKTFGPKRAVDGVSLRVPAGSFFGIVGPNGAGKTTTLRMACGLLRPDAGRIELDGVDVWTDPAEAKRRYGLVPDTPILFDRLSGREVLEFNGLLRGLDPELIRERSAELLAVLGLAAEADRLVGDYSLGMTKKVALACALLHAPRVLILDEPFGAIDPLSTQVVESILRRFTEGGGTVVFSSHVMDVVERLCDQVAIIADGRVLASGSIASLAGGRRLQDVFIELLGGTDALGDGLAWLSAA